MIVYRALNSTDFDINANENGLYSKKNVSDSLRDYIDFILYAENISMTNEQYEALYEYYRKEDPKIISTNIMKIIEAANDKNAMLYDIIRNELKYYYENNTEKCLPYHIKFLEISSTLIAYLQNGSRGDYDWISFSKNIDTFFKYYMSQEKKHMGVCIDSNIDMISDNGLLAFDVSSAEAIRTNPFIYKQSKKYGIYERPLMNSRAIMNALSDGEVAYYNHIPKERLFFLEPLQVDMMYNGMLNYDYFNHSEVTRKFSYQIIIDWLWDILENYPTMYKSVFNALYIKRMTVNELVREASVNINDVLMVKEGLLELLNNFNGEKYFKKSCDKVKVMERNPDLINKKIV